MVALRSLSRPDRPATPFDRMDAMTMQTQTHAHAEIEAVFAQLHQAHADKDADAIADAYAPDAVVYDLAPPLGRRGVRREEIAAWLATWDGPVEIDARDIDRSGILNRIQPHARSPRRREAGF